MLLIVAFILAVFGVYVTALEMRYPSKNCAYLMLSSVFILFGILSIVYLMKQILV